MNCLVTGATGFVGRHLCQHLRARGAGIVALSRSGASLADGTPTASLDLAAAAVPTALLQGVDTVFHLAGVAHRHGSVAEYTALNEDATLRLARQAARSGVRCFVHLSSVRAMGPAPGVAPRTEVDGVVPQDLYGRSKWRAERALREQAQSGSMSVVVLRPAPLYGPAVKGNLRAFARAAVRGLPRPPPDGRRTLLAVEDLVDLMCRVAARPPPGCTIWIAGDGAYSTRELYDCLRSARGLPPGRAWLPRAGWRLAAALIDRFSPRSGETTWSKLFGTDLYDSSAVVSATGWRPQRRLEEVAGELLQVAAP